MSRKIKIGIIGSGFARTTQIPGFQNCPGAEIVSIASARLENAERTAREFNIPHFTAEWSETVERDDIDLISIVTPPVLHKEMALVAMSAGKAVLCEKPMAMNAAETAEMLDAANGAGTLALIDHELRFVNGRLHAHKMLRDGGIGKIRHAKYHFCSAGRGNPDLPWTWWSDETSGGGALGAIGSHVIDSFRWFLGTEISSVFCQLNTHVKERPFGAGHTKPVTTDDECMMTLRFADGPLTEDATANVSISMVEAGNTRNTIEFFGTDGALRVEDGGEIFSANMNDNVWEPVEIELGSVVTGMRAGGWSRGFTAFSQKIIAALQSGENKVEGAATFEDGHRVQLVLDAARESDKTRAIIKL